MTIAWGGTTGTANVTSLLATGSAYVYTPDASGVWSQVAALTGAASYDSFGSSVAIDGDTCVIGAYGTNSYAGSAYVYGSNAAPAEPTGACCVSSDCFDGTDAQCTAAGGTWLGEGASCDDCLASCAGDTDGNGVVDIEDLLNMMGSWGACP